MKNLVLHNQVCSIVIFSNFHNCRM